MSLAARPPGGRKSLSATDLNTFDPSTLQPFKAKKRAYMSVGGEGLAGLPVSKSLETVKVQSQEAGKGDELSPRRKARRALQPRKSILKSISGNNVNENEDETENLTFIGEKLGYAHTVAFGRDGEQTGRASLASRRVSFAPSAHVRMLYEPEAKAPRRSSMAASAMRAATGSGSSRRSSTGRPVTIAFPPSAPPHQNITFIPEGESQGEASMDLETDSEGELSDEEGVEMGAHQDGRVSFDAAEAEAESDGELEDDDGEMDMDGTQVYGGIIRRQSTAASQAPGESSFVSEMSTQDGEEKTMEFTIAIGGLIPQSPPVGANRGRKSIGYNVPAGSSASQAGHLAIRPGTPMDGELDMDMDMDETIAIGGIIGADESLSDGSDGGTDGGRTMTFSFGAQAGVQAQNAAHVNARMSVGRQSMASSVGGMDDEDGMDFTQASGGIIGHIATSPARGSSSSSTRPSQTGNTPSFARPTQSSAQKNKSLSQSQSSTTTATGKRNVFAPSPSPFKSTPRKGGMEVAGEVAKRLSFGSVTSSGGAAAGHKRARSDGDEDRDFNDAGVSSSAKRARTVTLGESVFGSAPSTSPVRPKTISGAHFVPTARPGTPRRTSSSSISIANRSATPAKLPLSSLHSGGHSSSSFSAHPPRSPFRSPFRRAIAQTAGLLAPDHSDPPSPAGPLEPIRLATFLHNAGIEFLDRLPTAKRRVSNARGVLGRSVNGVGEREFGLHEYAEAEVHKIWWRFYDWAARKVLDDINARQTELGEMEETYDRLNPPVVQEYLSATDDDRQLFEMTFKAFKTNTQLKARGGWYDWKMGTVEAMRPNVEEVLEDMRVDHERLTQLSAETDELLPSLRERWEAVQAELAKEQEIAAELLENDQNEIADFKEAIREQGTQIEGFTAELNEVSSKLQDLQDKLDEQKRQKAEHLAAIADAKSRCGQFSKSDVAKLQDEYQSLQTLHMWRVASMTPQALELVVNDEIALHFRCAAHLPVMGSASISLLAAKEVTGRGKRAEADRRARREGMFRLLEAALEGLKATKMDSLSQFVQSFATLYTATLHIRSELALLGLRFPVHLVPIPMTQDEEPALVVSATMVIPPSSAPIQDGKTAREASKVCLEWRVDVDTLVRWPEGFGDIDIRARTIYGSAEEDVLAGVATDTMASAVAQGYQGVFASCCMDVMAHCAA